MNVAACLQPAKLARLKGAAGARHRVHAALDWAHAEAIIRRQPVDVLVVDPQFDATAEPRTDRIREVRSRHRSLPMIVYSVLAAQTLRPLVELGREGIEQVVLYGLDDDPEQLRALIERQPGVALAEQVLMLLQRPLSRSPERFAQAFERLMRTPSAFNSVEDLAFAARVPRRTMYRQCARIGFASPRALLCGSRLLRAYAFLRGPDYGIEVIARHTGLGNADQLTMAMRWGVSTTPARARERMGPEEFTHRLAATLAPGAAIDLAPWADAPPPRDASAGTDVEGRGV